MKIILDQKINLTDICGRAGWHHATAVEALKAEGIGQKEAETFIDYAFECKAKKHRPPRPEAYLADLAKRVFVPSLADSAQVSVSLDAQTIDTLRRLGKGNLSAGVRLAASRVRGGQ